MNFKLTEPESFYVRKCVFCLIETSYSLKLCPMMLTFRLCCVLQPIDRLKNSKQTKTVQSAKV